MCTWGSFCPFKTDPGIAPFNPRTDPGLRTPHFLHIFDPSARPSALRGKVVSPTPTETETNKKGSSQWQ